MQVPEPRFTRREVDLLLESRRLEREPRGSHGFRLSEATDPKNRGKWVVPPPVTDYAEAVVAVAKAARRKQYPDEDQSALLWRVELNN